MRSMKSLTDHLGKIALILIALGAVGFVAVTPILGSEWGAQDVEPHPKFIWYETTALKVLIFSTALLSIGSVLIIQKIINLPVVSSVNYPSSTLKGRIAKYSNTIGLVPLGSGIFASFLYLDFPPFFGEFGIPNYDLQFGVLAISCFAVAGFFLIRTFELNKK
jgi:hypothetical protein